MALVLNAVAGARRAQRNNARSADVNRIAAGVNEYIASRNALPGDWEDIAGIVDPSNFGHYDPDATNAGNDSINNTNSWTATLPAAANKGEFTWAAVMGGTTWVAHATANLSADELVVVQRAGCSSTTTPVAGGIREMAIIYKLEGQTDSVCLEI